MIKIIKLHLRNLDNKYDDDNNMVKLDILLDE